MASSGTITGSGVGTSPYLILDWTTLQQDIPNNRSQLRLTLKCYSQYYVNFSATKTGTLQGTSFSYSGGMTGSNITKTLYTKDIWVTHNSDGTKSLSLSGVFNINITWSGSSLSSLSVNGTVTLNTIPRASLLNSFSMGAHLATSTANSINLSITRYSTSFTHDITLKLGSYTVATWTGQGAPTSLSLTSTQVNNMLTRITSSTTATVTLTVQTKSGSSNIGSAVSRNATATVASSVTPTATGLSVSIYGSGRDSVINKFVRNISRVTSSFSASAGYGASISARSIVIRRDSDKANSQTISSASGTTGIVTLSGTYEAVATITDSRGRTATQRVTFTVHNYTTPQVTTFTARRTTADDTIVTVTRAGSFTPLTTGDNTLTILIQRRIGSGSWSTVQSTSTTSSTFSGTVNSTGVVITSSYEFRITITDSFGKVATASVTVSTSKVVLAIKKNESVGIGKIPENGVLDVGGKTFINGVLPNQSSSAASLQVNGFIRTGSIYLHQGNEPNATNSPLTNSSGTLRWNGNEIWHSGLDSGWINLSLSGATAYSSGLQPRYRKIGNTVFLEGEMKLTSSLAAGGVTAIGTLPSGYRPPRNNQYICQGSGNAIWLFAVNSNGTCEVGRYRNGDTSASISTSTWLPFAVSFAV